MAFRSPSSQIIGTILVWMATVVLVPGRAGGEVPEYYRSLIDEAKVTVRYYDPAREPRKHRGYTHFRFDVFYEASFQYDWRDRPAARELDIRARISEITYKLTNEVELPESFNGDARWDHPLVRHEFDHVAMTVDPRIRMLIEHLCKKVPRIVRKLPPETAIDDALVKTTLHEEVDPRYKAVIDLMVANQHAFDRTTQHGSLPLADREAFFRSLFTEPNLKAHRFTYLSEVADLLRQKSYREAALPYQLTE